MRQRELVYRRAHSPFAGTLEYIFKHVILHDVTYTSVLLKVRRVYHRQAAQWLRRVAEAAHNGGAFREATAAAERALALLPLEERAARADLLRIAGVGHKDLGDYAAARERLNAALALAREAGQPATAALALCGLASLAYHQGALAGIHAPASEALALARASGDQVIEALALFFLSVAADVDQHDLALATRLNQESLALRRKLGRKLGVCVCLSHLGEIARSQRDYATRNGSAWSSAIPKQPERPTCSRERRRSWLTCAPRCQLRSWRRPWRAEQSWSWMR